MFKLLRYFSIASLVSILAATVGLSLLQRKLAADEVLRLGEAGNAEITRVVANAHGETLRAFLALARALPPEQLKGHRQTARLHELLRAAVDGTSVIKIKLYSPDGRTVYSSEPRQIGEDKSRNGGFLAAHAGRVATEMTQRDHFSAFEKQLEDRAVLSSYLPLRSAAGEPLGAVVEVYQDVTPFLRQAELTQRNVVAGVAAILLALYGVLFLIVRHADRILRRQAGQSEADARALRAAGDELELRVAQMHQVDARRERYLALSKLLADWFWDQDAQFRFIDLDSTSNEFGGIGRTIHLGKTRWDLPHTEPVDTTWEAHRAELAAHRPFRNLLLRRTPASGARYVNVSGEPVFDADGRFTGYRGVASDVTERVVAELALAGAREALAERGAQVERYTFLQTLLDALPVGVSLVDRNLAVVATNEASRRLLDLPAEVFCSGVALESVVRYNAERGEFGPGDVGALVEARMALAREPRPHRFERVRPDGSTLEIHGVPLPDGSMVTTYTDVTERRRAEHALLAAKDAAVAGSRAKSAFLAVMSHEIRTPMNAVIGLLELLGLTALDAEQRDTVATVRDSSKSLLRLIDDVLDFSKIEAGKLELHEEAASLAQMFEAAHQTFSGVASQKGIVLRQCVDARIAPAVFVDRLRLRQIINNFLSNAVKFTARGQVELAAELVERREHDDRLRISVRDTGVGMDARGLERLFEPFSQADAAVERRYGGTGLGLSICQRLAELMGGAIEVASAPGVGTCIALTLTLRHASQADLQAVQPPRGEGLDAAIRGRSAPPPAAARDAGTLVLVVDDHPTNRRMVARQLNILGYAAQTAADGREALEQWRRGGIGLLITDCQMPGMDGYQLAGAIRAGEPDGQRLPIVASTANVSQEAFDQCHAVGMDDVLAKPVELATLKRLLDRWLPIEATPDATPDATPALGAAAEVAAPALPDFAAVAELAQGDAALQCELLQDFRHANSEDFDAAARALRECSAAELARCAHRIGGAAQIVGAAELSQGAAALEQAVHAGDWEGVAARWTALQQQRELLDQRIATCLRRLAQPA